MDGDRRELARPRQKPAPVVGKRCSEATHIATAAAHCAGNTRDRIHRIPAMNIDHEPATIGTPPSHPRGQAGFTAIPDPGCSGRRETDRLGAIRDRPKAIQIAMFRPAHARQRPYFSSDLHPILGVPVRRLWK